MVALAGPLLNLIVGVAIAVGLRYVPGYTQLGAATDLGTGKCTVLENSGQTLEHCLRLVQPAGVLRLEQFAIVLALTSIVVALVNVLPLYPLDAYKVVFAFLPSPQAVTYRRWEPYMEAIVLVIFFVLPYVLGLLGIGFSPAIAFRAIANSIFVGIAGDPGFRFALAL